MTGMNGLTGITRVTGMTSVTGMTGIFNVIFFADGKISKVVND